MNEDNRLSDLLQTIDDARSLLTVYDTPEQAAQTAPPLPSLLAQCEDLLAQSRVRAPIRLIHHFACTGGTLMSKVISAMPNVVLLSEIDPLSTMAANAPQPQFAPTDLILGARHAFRKISEPTLTNMFLQSLQVLYESMKHQGQSLVLRDHSHSHFCVARDPDDRPTLRDILRAHHDTLSLVTVRHPLESYISLKANNWHLKNVENPLEDYARRYHRFLDVYDGTPIIRFEDFLEDPEKVSAQMCAHLDLPWSPTQIDIFNVVKMSGDSGRGGDVITPRARKPIPEDLQVQIKDAQAYHSLCKRLSYEAEDKVAP